MHGTKCTLCLCRQNIYSLKGTYRFLTYMLYIVWVVYSFGFTDFIFVGEFSFSLLKFFFCGVQDCPYVSSIVFLLY